MNIIDALLGEHAVYYALFTELEQLADNATSCDELARAVAPVATALVSHAHLEDDVLFPPLREQLGPEGLVTIMADEHTEIDRVLQQVLRATDLDTASGDLLHALDLAREHFEKEETVLFLDAREALSADTCMQLGAQWAQRRGVTLPP